MHGKIAKDAMARLLFLACAVLFGTTNAAAQDSMEKAFVLKEIGPDVWAALPNPNAKVPTVVNAGFVIGDDGVAVVDTLFTFDAKGNPGNESNKDLLTEIRKLTKLPIRYVINTHHHPDHTGGNGIFAAAGAVVVAQHNVRGWIQSENLKLLGNNITAETKAFIEALVPPAVGYDHALDLYLGARKIQVRSFPGHTGGDSVVLIPDSRIAFGGDLLRRNTMPSLADGRTRSWIDSIDTLSTNLPDYTFVPGHGEPGRVRDFEPLRDYLATLRKLVAESQFEGKSGTSLVEAVMPALTGKYSHWDYFKYLVEANILDTEAELNGKKTLPQTQ